MTEQFTDILREGGKSNSLGRAAEVLQIVLADQSRLEELYQCLFEDDVWLRMRAIDTFEKVCREYPAWIEPYLDRLFDDFASDRQASIQWHIAQIVGETHLTSKQQQRALTWLVERLEDDNVDWIVAANSMATLAKFVTDGLYDKDSFIKLLQKQQNHRSNAVVKRATKLLNTLH